MKENLRWLLEGDFADLWNKGEKPHRFFLGRFLLYLGLSLANSTCTAHPSVLGRHPQTDFLYHSRKSVRPNDKWEGSRTNG